MPILKSWLLVGLCALVLGTAAQWLGPRPIPWVEDYSRRVEWRALQAGVEIVDVPSAREIAQAGKFLVFDARKKEDFDAGHLPGALSFPFESRLEAYNEFAALLSPEQPVMVYCSGRDCDDALLLGDFLREQGSARVVLFLEGFAGWKEAGHPVE